MTVPLSLLSDASSAGLRRMLFTTTALAPLHAFPQKDIPAKRVFEEAKLSTLVLTLAYGTAGEVLRIYAHAANAFDPATPYTDLPISRLLAFDPTMLTVPIGNPDECELAVRILTGPYSVPLRDLSSVLVGEIDMTLDRDCVAPSGAGTLLVKGAHIQRYYLRNEPKQGEQEYISVPSFQCKYASSPKAQWRDEPRTILQGVTGTDDYRRIKPCMAPAGLFLANSVNFLSADKAWQPHALLALMGSALTEWRFRLTSGNNNVNNYEIESLFAAKVRLNVDDRSSQYRVGDDVNAVFSDLTHSGDNWWDRAAHEVLDHIARTLSQLEPANARCLHEFQKLVMSHAASTPFEDWSSAGKFKDLDYFGWDSRYPSWKPDETTLADGRWYPNGVAPPLAGNGSGDIPWNLIARVYPSYPLPGIDAAAWEAAAWEEFCDLLRKNKARIGNAKIRADITGRGAVVSPTGPLKKLQETFLKFHREVRENRAKAAELDFLIDRIVFKLFDLTLDEQKLILSRVGPGRPLPPRRGRRTKPATNTDEGPGLFQ